ncbi:MAG: acyl carrier protein [Micromonosporaceae bacterium]
MSLSELAALLLDVTGEEREWAARVTPAARLEEDLRLDSVELAALGDLLRRRCGDGVDLPGYVAGLSIDDIIRLTVGDVLAYLARCA